MMPLDYMDLATAISLRGLGTLDADEVCCLHAIDQQALLDSLGDDELGALGAAAKRKKGKPAQIKKPGQGVKPANANQQAQIDRLRAQLARRTQATRNVRQQLQQEKASVAAAKTAADDAHAALRRAQTQLAQRTKVNQKIREKNRTFRANNAALREAIAAAPSTVAPPPIVPAVPDQPNYRVEPYIDAGFRPGVLPDYYAQPPQMDSNFEPAPSADFSMFDGAPIEQYGASSYDQYQGDSFGWDEEYGDGGSADQDEYGQQWGRVEEYGDAAYFIDDYGDDGDPALGSWLSKAFKRVTGTRLSNVTGSIAGSVPIVGGILRPIVEGINSSGSPPTSIGPVIPPPAPAPKATKPRSPAFWLAVAGIGVGALALFKKGGR